MEFPWKSHGNPMISGARGEPQGRRYRPGTSLGSHGRATDRHLVARVEATGQEATWTTWIDLALKWPGFWLLVFGGVCWAFNPNRVGWFQEILLI